LPSARFSRASCQILKKAFSRSSPRVNPNLAEPWSDIEWIGHSPRFDGAFARDNVHLRSRAAAQTEAQTGARTEARIEPIPCGACQWEEDDATPSLPSSAAKASALQPEPQRPPDGDPIAKRAIPNTRGPRQRSPGKS